MATLRQVDSILFLERIFVILRITRGTGECWEFLTFSYSNIKQNKRIHLTFTFIYKNHFYIAILDPEFIFYRQSVLGIYLIYFCSPG